MHLACHYALHLELAMHWSSNEWQAVWFPINPSDFFLANILFKSVKYFQQTFWNEVDFAKADGWSDGRTSEGSETQLFSCMLSFITECTFEACTTSTCVDGSSTSCCKEVHWSAGFIEWGEAGNGNGPSNFQEVYGLKLKLKQTQWSDFSDEQVCLKAGLMIKRLFHRTVIIPQQVPELSRTAVFVGCLKIQKMPVVVSIWHLKACHGRIWLDRIGYLQM